MDTFIRDVRYALRSLAKNPGFLSIVVLSLALGIGANSTIFSVVDAMMSRTLPYHDPDRLTVIWATEAGHPDWRIAPPIAELIDWKTRNNVFDDIALTSGTESNTLSGIGEPEPIGVQFATPNFFGLLGVQPALGRVPRIDEIQDEFQTIVISDAFWKRKFNRDPNVLGKSVNVERVVSTIVGVMPPGFAPFYGGVIDLWVPINAASARYSSRQDHWLMSVARLKRGVTIAQAQLDMNVVAKQLENDYPASNKGIGERVVPLHQELHQGFGQILYPLLGAVGFVLLIACVNVGNLLQSRTEIRHKEFAIRASMGASRRRVFEQLLVECGLLSLFGGGLGIIITIWGIQLIRKLAGDFPNADSIRIDAHVLLFTLLVSLATTVLFGLAPSINASRVDLNAVLREGGRWASSGSGTRSRHILAISEIALAMVLLVGAGLMINTFLRLQRVNPGFDSSNLLTMRIDLPEGGKYLQRVPGGDMEKASPLVATFRQELLEQIAALPGVESVGMSTTLPIRGFEGRTFTILGRPAPTPNDKPESAFSEVSPGFFQTMRIPLKRGRYLRESDTLSSPWVVVITEALALRYFPDEDPIGHQLLLGFPGYPLNEDRPRQIVGVIADVKQFGLGQSAPPFLYTSFLQQQAVFPGGNVMPHLMGTVVIRTSSNLGAHEADLTRSIKQIVTHLDPDQPVTDIMTMQHALAASISDWRFYLRLLGSFAAIALLLAVIGIYGVMSYFVNQRTREIGIRMALGAQRADVLAMIVTLGLKMAAIGIAVGSALALGLTQLIRVLLYGVKPTDPLTFVSVAILLAVIALLACLIPAIRAVGVDPTVALRYE
ncbi:MAG TPA: ABC transporter permease [Candidatus Acidoferrum sp.]|nr:ABC transporter permease [Candidatus Acidoferrum sp.]